MDLRNARPGEAEAVSVRDYLTVAANATGTHEDALVTELERWAEIKEDARQGELSDEVIYLERFDGSLEELRVRLEGFRQVTGVSPERILELHDQSEAGLLDFLVVPEPDESSGPG